MKFRHLKRYNKKAYNLVQVFQFVVTKWRDFTSGDCLELRINILDTYVLQTVFWGRNSVKETNFQFLVQAKMIFSILWTVNLELVLVLLGYPERPQTSGSSCNEISRCN